MIQLLRLDLSTNYHCCHLLGLAQLTIDQTPAVSDKTFSARSHFRFFVKVWNSLPLSLPWEENVTAHCLGVVCCRRSSSRLSKAASPLCPPAPPSPLLLVPITNAAGVNHPPVLLSSRKFAIPLDCKVEISNFQEIYKVESITFKCTISWSKQFPACSTQPSLMMKFKKMH